MSRNAAFCAGAVLLALLTGPVVAQPASSARGHELSQRLCTGCHAVEARPTGPIKADVPTFAAIAARPDVSAQHIAGAIIIPHPAMPGVQLTIAEIRDIVAYIVSLKPQ
jgi:mono/diheme cytochrome c family protein